MAETRVRLKQPYHRNRALHQAQHPEIVRHAVDALVTVKSKRNEITKRTRRLRILPSIDGRGMIARKYRDLCLAIIQDQGGPERCTEVRLQLIRRFAAAGVLAEALEAAMADGDQIDIGQHALLTSSLVRLASRLGLDRKAKTINTPALKDYLNRKANGDTIDHDEAE